MNQDTLAHINQLDRNTIELALRVAAVQFHEDAAAVSRDTGRDSLPARQRASLVRQFDRQARDCERLLDQMENL